MCSFILHYLKPDLYISVAYLFVVVPHFYDDYTGPDRNSTSLTLPFPGIPKAGRVLIFYHRLMHEAFPSNNKYIIRTDLVFKRKNPMLTSDVDKEAFQLYLEAQELAEKGLNMEAQWKFRCAFRMSENLRKVYKM